MSHFWAAVLGFIAGIGASILANYYSVMTTQRLAFKSVGRLVGTWEAYNMHGRDVDTTPMPGAGLTEIHSKPHWWSPNSAVLDVHAEDIDASTGHKRDQEGHIAIDPAFPWLATRITRYTDSDEISKQELLIGRDFRTIYVFPVATFATLGDVYGKHALRRSRRNEKNGSR